MIPDVEYEADYTYRHFYSFRALEAVRRHGTAVQATWMKGEQGIMASFSICTVMEKGEKRRVVYRKSIPTPNWTPFLPSSPFLKTKGKEKLSSNRATGCA